MSMSSMTSVRYCEYCKTEKPWIWNGKKLKDGSRIYVNADNARWAGKRCPDCEKTRVQAAVRCDSFERELVARQLEERGFEVVSRSLPIKVSKDGQIYTVDIKRAFTEAGKVVVEAPADKGKEIVVLLFESIRICSPDQIQPGAPGVAFWDGSSAPTKPTVNTGTTTRPLLGKDRITRQDPTLI